MARGKQMARSKILDAADALFGEHGFDGTTTRQIAERCGVNKALIHYHFSTKQALFEAVLDRYYGRLRPLLDVVVQHEGGARERYRMLIDAYADFLQANAPFSRMLQREISGGRHVGYIAAQMVPPFLGGVAAIEAVFPASRTSDLSAPHLLVSFFGMTVAWFAYAPVVEELTGEDPLSPRSLDARKRHLRLMLDLVIDALEGGEPTPKGRRTRPAP